jgi:hypothetical protein
MSEALDTDEYSLGNLVIKEACIFISLLGNTCAHIPRGSNNISPSGRRLCV